MLTRSSRLLLTLLFCLPLVTISGAAHAARSHASVTLTLEGPNQFTNSGSSFGPAWDKAIATFETLNPGVTVKINVLPLTTFSQIEATQLAAGTAPALMFNQTTYKPYQVVHLDRYLHEPNPYAPQRKQWIDWFDSRAYNVVKSADGEGYLDWVPFNLVGAGLFVDKTAFARAHVSFPIRTFADLMSDCKTLKSAGYAPLAMDNSYLGVDWTLGTIENMMMAPYYSKWNVYLPNGKRGKNSVLTSEDLARAIRLQQFTPSLPQYAEGLRLLKEVFDNCATPSWSGIKGLTGAGVDLPDFIAGRAAMAWGVNFGISTIQAAHVSFKVASMAFPTITKATTSLSTDFPAQFGVAAGGTSYMIPATTKGAERTYAVRFLQFMTAPKYNQPWVKATTSIPAVQTVKAPGSVAGFSTGAWGKDPRNGGLALGGFFRHSQDSLNIMQGYLLGTTSLSQTENALEKAWQDGVTYAISQTRVWQNQPWAK